MRIGLLVTVLGIVSVTGCGPADREPVRVSTQSTDPPAGKPGDPKRIALPPADPDVLTAGAAKVDISDPKSPPIVDRLYARAVAFRKGDTVAVVVGIDAVAIGEIGRIRNDFLANVRKRVGAATGINTQGIVINASHCHGIVCEDVEDKTVEVIQRALSNLVPVRVGSAIGHENRIMENRRLLLKSGKTVDVRHAYALPPDDEIAWVGPIDPQIGVLRIDRRDGTPLAVLFNFACHPIMGLPGGESTADISGYACGVIEENLGREAVAVFVQGCGGDINPVRYKEVHGPRHAEPWGNQLGLSTLKAVRSAKTGDDTALRVVNESLDLPRADLTEPIESLEKEQARLLKSLRGTSLNLKTFIPLMLKYNLSADFPSEYAHRYLQEKAVGRNDLAGMDAANRRDLKAYVENILTMEAMTRVQTNLALLRKHHAANLAAERRPMTVEVAGLRIGDFRLITFPGELVVEIGLNIKKASPHPRTFVAGYTNGYVYYCPTAQQLKNRGGAQEDSDCRLAPEWQKLFEEKAAAILRKL